MTGQFYINDLKDILHVIEAKILPKRIKSNVVCDFSIPTHRLQRISLSLCVLKEITSFQCILRDTPSFLLSLRSSYDDSNIKSSNADDGTVLLEHAMRLQSLCKICCTNNNDDIIQKLRIQISCYLELINAYRYNDMHNKINILIGPSIKGLEDLVTYQSTPREHYMDRLQASQRVSQAYSICLKCLREHAYTNHGYITTSYIGTIKEELANFIELETDLIQVYNDLYQYINSYYAIYKAWPCWGSIIDYYREDCEVTRLWVLFIEQSLLPQHLSALTLPCLLCDRLNRRVYDVNQLIHWLRYFPYTMRLLSNSDLISHISHSYKREMPLILHVNKQTKEFISFGLNDYNNNETSHCMPQPHTAANGITADRSESSINQHPSIHTVYDSSSPHNHQPTSTNNDVLDDVCVSDTSDQEVIHISYDLPITYEEYLCAYIIDSDYEYHLYDIYKVEIALYKAQSELKVQRISVCEKLLLGCCQLLDSIGYEFELPACPVYTCYTTVMICKCEQIIQRIYKQHTTLTIKWVSSAEGIARYHECINMLYSEYTNTTEVEKHAKRHVYDEKMQLLNDAEVYNVQGSMSKYLDIAYRHRVKVLEVYERTYQSPHLLTGQAMVEVASILVLMGKRFDARQWLSKALRSWEQLDPPPDYAIAEVQVKLCAILIQEQYWQNALDVLTQLTLFYTQRATATLTSIPTTDQSLILGKVNIYPLPSRTPTTGTKPDTSTKPPVSTSVSSVEADLTKLFTLSKQYLDALSLVSIKSELISANDSIYNQHRTDNIDSSATNNNNTPMSPRSSSSIGAGITHLIEVLLLCEIGYTKYSNEYAALLVQVRIYTVFYT